MSVIFVIMFMIRLRVIQIMELILELPLKICPKIGPAHYVELPKMTFLQLTRYSMLES